MNPPPSDIKTKAREALLEAAAKLFVAKGYSAVSTRELAEAAGVNLGAIQYHFGSKAQLFVETVRRTFESNDCGNEIETLVGEVKDQEDAVRKLSAYVFGFMNSLLHPTGPQPCRMMFREILGETSEEPEMFEALVSSVVNDFIRPMNDFLLAVLEKLRPSAKRDDLALFVQSIVGQCSFYVTHRPFAERLRNCNFAESPNFERSVIHIIQFTLRGLGLEEKIIQGVPKIVTQLAEESLMKCEVSNA